ncbi:ATP-grasp domain-containing protein [Haloprofundus sp. MHR1]|nr:ATP-grasp domain-containing protein [Haloprofundus sp. MHR1]
MTTTTGHWDSVIVPANFSINAVACLRSLAPRDVHTIVVSEHDDVPAFASKYCNEKVLMPSPYDNFPAYKESLLALATRPDVRTVVPTREMDAYILSKYREEFAEHVTVGWPTFDSLRTAQDGKELAEVAERLDIPVPKTETLDEVTDWDRKLIAKQRYSLLAEDYVDFLEPGTCEGRMDPIYLESGSEPDTDAIIDEMLGHVPITQEIVKGVEYSFRALYDHGEPVATSLRRQLRGKTYAGGMSVFREMTHDPEVEELGERLLTHLDWHGLASVQFIKDHESGEFYFLEINPRIWASVLLDVRAGADYPYNYWLMTQGRTDEIDPGYEEGVATHLLAGELQYLWSVVRHNYPNVDKPSIRTATWEVASSIYEHPHFDFVSLDDPRPFAQGILNTLSRGR